MGRPLANGVPTIPGLDIDPQCLAAAMRVTGISEEDLVMLAPLSPEEALAEPPLAARRREVHERRRQACLEELQRAAGTIDRKKNESNESPLDDDDIERSVLQALEKDYQRVDRMKSSYKRNVSKAVDRQVERKRELQATQRAREEREERSRQAQAQKAAAAAKTVAERAQNQQKREQQLAECAARERARTTEVAQKLREQGHRMHALLDEKARERQEAVEARRRKMAENIDRSIKAREARDAQAVASFTERLERDDQRRDRMHQAIEEKALEVRERREKHCVKSPPAQNGSMDQDRLERVSTLLENAQTARHARIAEVSERTRAAREKEFERFARSRQEKAAERRQRAKMIKQRWNESYDKSQDLRQQHSEEAAQRKTEMRSILDDLVKQNKARNERREDCKRELTLDRIRAEKVKFERIVEQRQHLSDERATARKDFVLARMHLTELETLRPDTCSKRVNQLLKKLGAPPLEATPRARDGEEGEQRH